MPATPAAPALCSSWLSSRAPPRSCSATRSTTRPRPSSCALPAGAGARSLAAMAARDGLWRRPLLGLRRALVRDSCIRGGTPHLGRPGQLRPGVRPQPGAHARCSRCWRAPSARGSPSPWRAARTCLRADADALDALAAGYCTAAGVTSVPPGTLAVRRPGCAGQRGALPGCCAPRRSTAGCPPTDLSAAHVAALDGLVTAWKGQGPLNLPGGVKAERRNGTLTLSAPTGARGSSRFPATGDQSDFVTRRAQRRRRMSATIDGEPDRHDGAISGVQRHRPPDHRRPPPPRHRRGPDHRRRRSPRRSPSWPR